MSESAVFMKTVGFGQKLRILVKNCGFRPKTTDFAVFEFKTRKLFISFQSRERMPRVSIFFSFFLFCGGGGFKSLDLIIKCVYLKLNWSIYFGKTADLGKNF